MSSPQSPPTSTSPAIKQAHSYAVSRFTTPALQHFALGISIVSILYCAAEGAVSIALGLDSKSRSLIFFGIQSAIEVASACIVTWRFARPVAPTTLAPEQAGERQEKSEEVRVKEARNLRVEKVGTWSIGILIAMLAVATMVSAVVALVTHDEPTTSPASLIVSASALVIMIILWLPKRYLARALDSSTMASEAACSLSCIQITLVVFVGALVFKLSRKAWWVDSAACIVLSLLFAREAWKMLRWVSNPSFDGGCCGGCVHSKLPANVVEEKAGRISNTPFDEEAAEKYRDLCECCFANDECRESEVCRCCTPSTSTLASIPCCVPVSLEGAKCCSREWRSGLLPRFMKQKSKVEAAIIQRQTKIYCRVHGMHSGETLCDDSCGTAEDDVKERKGAVVDEAGAAMLEVSQRIVEGHGLDELQQSSPCCKGCSGS